MTTTFPFTPSPQGPFQFSPTLDGTAYNAVVTWNLFGQRYYISLFDLNGTLIFCLPLIGSAAAINLASATWAQGIATATLAPFTGPDENARVYYSTGTLVNLTISAVQPDVYNGAFQVSIIDDTTFSYLLPVDDPGPATQLGMASYDVNLAGGYFNSRLVFRQSSQMFEVSP